MLLSEYDMKQLMVAMIEQIQSCSDPSVEVFASVTGKKCKAGTVMDQVADPGLLSSMLPNLRDCDRAKSAKDQLLSEEGTFG